MTNVADFKTAVGNAHWDINYEEFCRRAGFAQDSYAEEKWRQWVALAFALNAFDTSTLERIIDTDE